MNMNIDDGLQKEINMELANSEKLKIYAEQVKAMSKQELESELEKLAEDLADEEDEMRLMIGQTGVHINATRVAAYRESFAKEMAKIKEKQRLVNEALDTLS
jgi:orotidine-5'-phosphate decarboxylase